MLLQAEERAGFHRDVRDEASLTEDSAVLSVFIQGEGSPSCLISVDIVEFLERGAFEL